MKKTNQKPQLKKPPKEEAFVYKVSLETIGKTYQSEGVDLQNCINQLGLKWNDIKNKGVIKISFGNKSIEHLFNTKQLKRMFGNKLVRSLWAKRLILLMK